MKKFFVNHLPFLGKYKRFIKAYRDVFISSNLSFSQYGEDVFILDLIDRKGLSEFPFIDIGANHPTDISNTYLLYKKGMRGYTIDPNAELIYLHKKFRPEDKQFQIGCGNNNTVLKFNISKTPVISSFNNTTESYRSEYVPVLKIDDALNQEYISRVSFMNIDVEGMNFEVLEGAQETLIKCDIICIEFEDDKEKNKIINFLSHSFKIVNEVHCNLIFEKL